MRMTIKYLVTLLFLTTNIYFSCVTSDTSKHTNSKVNKRISSPDSVVDAILIERLGDATTSNSYHLYIVPIGKNYQTGYEKFIADHVRDLDIFWKENNFLVIQYKEARIFKFTNFWHSDSVNEWSYVVELRLKPLTDSFSLSEHDRWLFHKSDTLKNISR